MLLPREHLPLRCLDLLSPSGSLPLSAVYESNIRILDLEGRLGCSVLLARAEPAGPIYAVEQEEQGRYALCKLVSSFDLQGVVPLATTVYRPRLATGRPSWTRPSFDLPTTTPRLHTDHKKKRLAIEQIQSMVRKRPRSPSVAPSPSLSQLVPEPTPALTTKDNLLAMENKGVQVNENGISGGDAGENLDVTMNAGAVEDTTPPGAEDIFQNIRSQYFEALYHSKVGAPLPLPPRRLCQCGISAHNP
jgi:DNA replication regulator SLD3